MIYDENILMLYWWFAICVIYVMEFEDNLEFLQIEILNPIETVDPQPKNEILSVSSHFGNFVFGCFWQQSYQNIV